jgi:hypothetical protein
MHFTTLLAFVTLAFLIYKLYDIYFGRFGRKSRFELWRKFENGPVTIYVVKPRHRLEANGGISPASFYPRLKLAFATETDMRYLSELDLPSGIDICSAIENNEVMSLHFHGKKLCDIEKRKGSNFLKGELYALVDAERSNTRVVTKNSMVAV